MGPGFAMRAGAVTAGGLGVVCMSGEGGGGIGIAGVGAVVVAAPLEGERAVQEDCPESPDSNGPQATQWEEQ